MRPPRGTPAPFRLRPGLIVEILAFYDELRRRDRTVAAFERLMAASLEPSAEIDRGAERLLRLTRFLSAAFEVFERRIAETGRVDEHGLRARLLEPPDAPVQRPGQTPSVGLPTARLASGQFGPYRHIVVTVPDQSADPRGLWLADYDLLARMPGLERLDVIATENVLAAGFHQRMHDVLPGIEEERVGTPAPPPVLSAPEPAPGGDAHGWIVCRDREEELVEIARAIKRQPAALPVERTAVVFQRPLPYLYLARQVFPDAQVPYQALDALPLAAEPFAAALDLVFSFAIAEGTRASAGGAARPRRTGRSRLTATWSGDPMSRRPMRLLRDVKYLGGWERLASLAAETDQTWRAPAGRQRPCARPPRPGPSCAR